jgi:hypothetical protein
VFTWNFVRQTAERAVKVFAESLAALLLASKTGLLDAPWVTSLSAAGMAALVSVLVSIASRPVGAPDSPSLVRIGAPDTAPRAASEPAPAVMAAATRSTP